VSRLTHLGSIEKKETSEWLVPGQVCPSYYNASSILEQQGSVGSAPLPSALGGVGGDGN